MRFYSNGHSEFPLPRGPHPEETLSQGGDSGAGRNRMLSRGLRNADRPEGRAIEGPVRCKAACGCL